MVLACWWREVPLLRCCCCPFLCVHLYIECASLGVSDGWVFWCGYRAYVPNGAIYSIRYRVTIRFGADNVCVSIATLWCDHHRSCLVVVAVGPCLYLVRWCTYTIALPPARLVFECISKKCGWLFG